MRIKYGASLLLVLLLPWAVPALDVEVRVQAASTAIRSAQPGAPALESSSVDSTMDIHDEMTFLDEAVKAAWTYQGQLRSQPGGPQSPPPDEGALFRGMFREAFLSWEPVLGTFLVHGGKRIIQDSSAYAFKPLGVLSQGGAAEEGTYGVGLEAFLPWFSVLGWYIPELHWPQDRPEYSWYLGGLPSVQGGYLRLSGTFFSVDTKVLALLSQENWKLGFGLGGQVGDALTLRGEALCKGKYQGNQEESAIEEVSAMLGATYTWLDGATLMGEYAYSSTRSKEPAFFLRYNRSLGEKLEASALTLIDTEKKGGSSTLSLDQAWDHGGLTLKVSQAWNLPEAKADNPWLWTISAELRVLY